ncbi:F-box only protein 15 isoform X2 [Onychomys torridus]|uniref:F-box only protein 15 isoform X2 n=1 Tax=Onychomys torridus TaxID=38674 RepID=UPI00167FB04D|nr:F-box only protein 15 isoform X2 [Onychomys torridus]
MTGAWERSRTRKGPERHCRSQSGGVHRDTQPTSARAWTRLCARVRGSASLLHCRAAGRYLWVSMATGRGRMLGPGCFGLQALRGSLHRDGATWGSAGVAAAAAGRSGFRRSPGARLARGSSVWRQSTSRDQPNEKSSSICFLSLDRMPSEILLTIFSYLDAVSLLCIGCVSRRFYHLASDNFIWLKIYSAAFSSKRSHWKVNKVEETATSVSVLSVEDREVGYWKKEYITKQISSVKAALAHILKPVNSYTGLPVKTKEALRLSGLGWAIILREKSGKEHIMQHVDLSLNDTSVTVVWHGKNWPCLATLSTLDLCGVTPVFMDRYKTPDPNGPRWLSLIAKYDLSHLSKSTMVGCDRLVRIFCLNPGLLVGLWQKEDGLAFIMANLHFHRLVERSTLGSATLPYVLPPHSPFVDDSPEYGLQGYQLHIDMHGGGIFYLCSTFRNLFSRKGCIENGYVKFMVISLKNNREHLPLIGKVGLAWRTNVFDGFIESCSVVDVTLLDEHRKPFWCVSSPVCMRSAACPSDGPNFLGHTYYVDYMDAEGGVHAELVWIEETEEYFLVSLALYLSVAKINHWFGTKY